MKQYVALLRGINLGNKRKILMKDLRQIFIDLNFSNINTYIQTGNVIFNSEETENISEQAKKIKDAIFSTYGYDVPVIIRSKSDLEKIILSNPYIQEDNVDIKQLHLTLLEETPSDEKIEIIKTANYAPDLFHIIGNNVYIHCQAEYRNTKLGNIFFEKKMNITASTRTWKTVLKILQLMK